MQGRLATACDTWSPRAFALAALLVTTVFVAAPVACRDTLPASPDEVLPLCEEPGPLPLIFSWTDMPCPTADEVATVRREIDITFKDVPESPVVCGAGAGKELTYYEERLYSSLLFMRNVHFDAPLPWTTLSLYDWFRQAIRGIVIEPGDYSYCCSPSKVIHIAIAPRSSTAPWRRTADSLWTSGLVHEARHSDTGVFHTCHTNQGKDGRVSDLGAYGIQNLLMTWIAGHSDASPEMREWNRWSAKSHRLSAFCEECSNARAQISSGSLSTLFAFGRSNAAASCRSKP
jgi:hypothetical protein